VASLLLVQALFVVVVGASMAALQLAALPIPEAASESLIGPLVSVAPGLGLAGLVIVAGGGLALASVGLLRLREWAWVLALALEGVGLADALYETYTGQPQYVGLAFGGLVVLVLNQREVRQAVDRRHRHVRRAAGRAAGSLRPAGPARR
jgi:hypothetical protein